MQGSSEVGGDQAPLPKQSRKDVLRLFRPLFASRRGHFFGAFALLAISSGLLILGPVLIRHAIDTDIAGRDVPGLRRTVLVYLAAMLLQMGVFYVMRNWLEWIGQGMMAELKGKLFRHLLKLPAKFYDHNPPGQLMSRVENDTEALRMLFTTTSILLVGDVLLFIGMFAVMFSASIRLTLVICLLVPIMVGSGIWVESICRPYFVRHRMLTAEICSRLAEYLQGNAVIRAFAGQAWALGEFQKVNVARYKANFKGDVRWMAWFHGVITLESMAFGLILGAGGYWALQGLVTLGTLVMFMGFVRRFFEPIMRLSDQLLVIQKAMAAGERLFALFQETPREEPASPLSWPGLRQGIAFEDVWFRYTDDGPWVLKGVSFTVPAGEQWGVVGRTGSGKTTLVGLLLRFYDPTKGRITVDGRDIQGMTSQELRAHVGWVPQDLYLFPGALDDNLTLGRELSPQAVRRAVGAVRAESVFETMKEAGTELAERGANLSMGERQLLGFARAVVHEPPLLVLDEATSSVDPQTEKEIQDRLEQLLEKRTALIIAHRLATIQSCHNLVVLHQGEVVQQGTKEELLKRDGLFQRLYELHWSEEEDDEAAS